MESDPIVGVSVLECPFVFCYPSLLHLHVGVAAELRRLVKGCVTDAKPTPPNLTREQFRALTTLCKDNTIVMLQADKGNATVVMDTVQYESKIDEVLSDGNYSILDKDPTGKLERRLSKTLLQLEKLGELPTELRKRLTPAQSYALQLYGVPKIHKEGVPLRPIVSTIGSP